MKTIATRLGTVVFACFALFLSAPIFTLPVQAQTYFIQSQTGAPPFPFDPYDGADLLITEAGEVGAGGLYIVHWNAQGSNFVTTPIPIPPLVSHHFEAVTFAPMKFQSF